MTTDRRWRENITTSRPLNRVEDSNCPYCFQRGHMDVYASCVQWACGHTQDLPPLPSVRCAGIPRKS